MKKLTLFKGRTAACLILLCIVLAQGCKKDLLLQKKPPKSDAEIQKITFSDFKQDVNLDKLGVLKQRFASGSGKIMSISDGTGFGLSVHTDAVQKLITKDGVSYIFAMPLISPRAVEFSNLTIEVKGDKTIAFITTFTPTKAWNEACKKKHPIAFEGNITFIPISLETLNLTEALSSFKASPSEKIMSAPNKIMNTRACTTYYLYDYVTYGCSSGNHMPDDPNCLWNDPFSVVPAGEYRAGYHVIPRSYQICDDGVQSPVGSSGGGSGGADADTSPYTPGNYNPCDEPPLDGSTKKKNTPCDESPSPDVIEQVMASALLSKMLEINDNQRLQFINDPANATIVNDLLAYVGANGKTAEVVDFLNWAVGYLMVIPDADLNELFHINDYTGISIPNLDISALDDYPDFKNLVKDLPNFLKKYPNVLKALSYTTGFSEKKIMELMQPGKGPKVVVIRNLKDKNGYDILGHYDKATKTLQIDDGYVNGLSIVNSTERYQGIGLILTISTLHEFAHYATNENALIPVIKNRLMDNTYEPGWYFEDIIPPVGVSRLTPDNAYQWLKYYRIRPKNKL